MYLEKVQIRDVTLQPGAGWGVGGTVVSRKVRPIPFAALWPVGVAKDDWSTRLVMVEAMGMRVVITADVFKRVYVDGLGAVVADEQADL